MNFSLESTNIVVQAKEHNPSIISKEWLANKGIIKEKVNNFAHTPVFSLIETDKFDCIVDPERLFLIGKKPDSDTIKRILEIVKIYSKLLPEIPYKSIELRFIFGLTEEKKDLKALFSKNEELFISQLGKDYQIGGLLTFDYKNFKVRLRLTQLKDKIVADFSYFSQLQSVTAIEKLLSQYNDIIKQSEKIIGGLF